MAEVSVKLASVPFEEQIAFFRRKLNVPTNAWTDLWQEQHDHAFVIAGANRDDLLADFRAAVDKAINQGGTLESFRKDFDAIVAKHGWSYNGGRNWRSRVIYETNLRSSYAAGRYTQLQAVKATRPFWQYLHSDSVLHPRPMHQAWNGIVLHADDPWWRYHFCPNGWGCQCKVVSLSLRDLQRMGKSGPDKAPPIDMQTVTVGANGPSPRVVETPAGVDPGFGYTPGASAFGAQVEDALVKTARFPAKYAADSAAEILSNQTASSALDAQYTRWVGQAVASADAGELSSTLGALSPASITAMTAAGAEPATAAIVVDSPLVVSALSPANNTPLQGVVAKALPQVLRQPLAVLLDTRRQTLVYVTDVAGTQRMTVQVGYQSQEAQPVNVVNTVRGIAVFDVQATQSSIRSGDLVLVEGALP